MKNKSTSIVQIPSFEDLVKKNAKQLDKIKPLREIQVSGRIKFYGRPIKDEVALLYFAKVPALQDSDLISLKGIPVVIHPIQNSTGIHLTTEGTFSYRLITSEMKPLCLIVTFQNALSVQSSSFFKGNKIKVDFTDPKQVKGGQESLMPKGSIPVGNLNQDQWIDILDWAILGMYYGKYYPPADLDNNGQPINDADAKILTDCFLKGSAVEIPAAWRWVMGPHSYP
jgi:hypothetical protein